MFDRSPTGDPLLLKVRREFAKEGVVRIRDCPRGGLELCRDALDEDFATFRFRPFVRTRWQDLDLI